MGDRVYPQFAGHNAYRLDHPRITFAEGRPFEFQRLHGMGERLHYIVLKETNGRCRIYAPVGAHRDLLAYLVRRLLENGANSSSPASAADEDITPESIARDPFEALATAKAPSGLKLPSELYEPNRKTALGFDLVGREGARRARSRARRRDPGCRAADPAPRDRAVLCRTRPGDGEDHRSGHHADAATVARAIEDARTWDALVTERAAVLRRAADLARRITA